MGRSGNRTKGRPPYPKIIPGLFCGTWNRWGSAWGAKKVGEVPCRDGQTFFAQVDTTGKSKDRNGSSVTLVRWPDGHIIFAFLDTTCPARQRSMGAEALR